MIKKSFFLFMLLQIFSSQTYAWDTDATIDEIRFDWNRTLISFVSPNWHACAQEGDPERSWFIIYNPNMDENRKLMVSAALAAKMAQKTVHIQTSGCTENYEKIQQLVIK